MIVCGLAIAVGLAQETSLEKELARVVPELLREHQVPGAAVAIVREGRVSFSGGFGVADRESNRPVTSDTVFQVGSISKCVTACVLMQLVEAGDVELSHPVIAFLDRGSFPASRFNWREVTAGQLLSHTGGTSLRDYPGFASEEALPTLEESLAGATNGAGAVELVQRPGSRFRFSSGGYTILQLMIEVITEEAFAPFAKRTVFDPLGMTSSGFAWSVERGAAQARGAPLLRG